MSSQPPTRSHEPTLSTRWLVMLALYFGLQPISMDLSLPALPQLVDAFVTTPAAVQLTLSIFIGAFATAQLIVGPLSDRIGRRPVCMAGLLLATLCSLIAAMAPSLELLIAARAVQALGVCTVVVCGRAIVRDRYEPAAGAQVLSKVLSWMTLAPFLSPIAGGLLLQLWGWRAPFALMSVISALAMYACWRWQPETNAWRNPNATRPGELFSTYVHFLRSREFVFFTLMLTGSFAAMFSYISASAHVLMRVLDVSAAVYGVAFGCTTLGFLVGTILLRRLMPVGGLRLVLAWATVLGLGGSLLLLLLALAGVGTVAAVVLPMFLVTCGHGLIQPACTVGAAAPFPQQAGAAAALTGFIMNLAAALIGWALSQFLANSTVPMAIAIFLAALWVNGLYWLVIRPMLARSPALTPAIPAAGAGRP